MSDRKFEERLWHDLTEEEYIARDEDCARDREKAAAREDLDLEDGCRCALTDDDRLDNRQCARHSALRRAELRADWARSNPYAYGAAAGRMDARARRERMQGELFGEDDWRAA